MQTLKGRFGTANWHLWLIGWVTAVMSVLSFIYFHLEGTILVNIDSISRLMIARRVVDSWEPSFAQLGTVWLPLTHILSLPFISIDPLYNTGLAGSLISMAAFVIASLYLYKLVQKLTDDRNAALLGVIMFIVNVEILYLQATPMTELPLYATVLASTYYLLRFEQERRFGWLFWSSLSIALGSLIRYEAWFLLPFQAGVIGYLLLRQRATRHEVEAHLIFWGYWAFTGIAFWLLWNQVIVGDFLAFQRGEYAKPSLWVSADDPVIGSWSTAFLSYLYASLDNLGWIFAVGVVCLGVYLWQTRLRPGSLAPLTLWIFFPAFVAMLYLGQRPLYVPEFYDGDRYNTRFALIMLLPTIIFIAYVVRNRLRLSALTAGLAAVFMLVKVMDVGVINVQEVATDLGRPEVRSQLDAAAWLQANYDNTPLLLETYGNERTLFYSQISMRRLITEGTYQIWEQALEDPTEWVDWIVMRGGSPAKAGWSVPDVVWQTLGEDPAVGRHYELVYSNDSYDIYRLRQDEVSRR